MTKTKTEPKRQTRDVWLRVGSALLDKMTAASIAVNRDRSAWAEDVLAGAVKKGLPKKLDTGLMIESLQRDQRALLRVEENLADKVTDAAADLGVTLTDFVLFAMIGELVEVQP
jgi:hypothetical protein